MSPSRRETIAGLAASVAAVALPASGRAEARRTPLRRGVSLSHWFAQNFEGDDAQHYQRFIGPRRIAQLARCGFDHVRLPIEPAILFEDTAPSRFRARPIYFLRAAVELLQSHGLAVVLDLHPVGTAKDVLLTAAGAKRFIDNWKLLAAEFNQNSQSLVLEVLNEPTPLMGEAWWSLQGQAIEAIRSENSDIPIIANGGNWSNIEDLVGHKPYPMAGIIYSVHYYYPILFTQQASEWGWNVAARIANLDWPLDSSDASAVALRVTRDDEASRFVHDAVASGSFTSSSMTSAFDQLKRWQDANGHPPIYVGEFGVVAKASPPDARARWVRAARKAFEANGWGWAIWDLSPSFGLLRAQPSNPYSPWDSLQLDAELMTALGMSV